MDKYPNFLTLSGIVHNCRYYGYIQKKKGLAPEMKGIEAKRANSSKFEKNYQKELLEKLLNKETKENIIIWVDKEKERIRTLPLLDVSFPCKIGTKKYVNRPIFVRAYENTKKLNPKFSAEKGELFYYIFIDNPSSDRSVLAFNEKTIDFIKQERIDYNQVIRRNIDSKTETIFTAMGWHYSLNNQLSLF